MNKTEISSVFLFSVCCCFHEHNEFLGDYKATELGKPTIDFFFRSFFLVLLLLHTGWFLYLSFIFFWWKQRGCFVTHENNNYNKKYRGKVE